MIVANGTKLTTIAAALLVSGALAACGGGTTVDSPTPTESQTQTEAAPTELTLDTVRTMNSTLEELTGAALNTIQVQSMSVSPSGSISVDALDPAKPTELNQYVAYPDGRTDIRPYDYGGAEKYDALLTTLFNADLVRPETIVAAWEDSFSRVEGEPSELSAGGPRISRADDTGPVEITITNGPERDRQTVYYGPDGTFLRVS